MRNLLDIFKNGYISAFLNETNGSGTSVEDIEDDAMIAPRFLMTYTSKHVDEDVDIYLQNENGEEIVLLFVRQEEFRTLHIPTSGEFDNDSRYIYDYYEPHIYLNADGTGFMDGCEMIQVGENEDGVLFPGHKSSENDYVEISWPSVIEIFSNKQLLDMALAYSDDYHEHLIDLLFKGTETRLNRWSLSTLFEGFFFYCDFRETAEDSPVTMKLLQ